MPPALEERKAHHKRKINYGNALSKPAYTVEELIALIAIDLMSTSTGNLR